MSTIVSPRIRVARNLRRLAAVSAMSLLSTTTLAATQAPIFDYGTHWHPSTPLIEGNDGNLYGVGTFDSSPVVYRLTTSGAISTLHSFPTLEALSPIAKGPGGGLYVTSTDHLYHLNTLGTLTTLHTFSDADGTRGDIRTALVQAADGKWYGSGRTAPYSGQPTIYRYDPASGAVTTLHTFAQNTPATLTRGVDGSIYGFYPVEVNDTGRAYAVAFKLLANGTLSTLHAFAGDEGADMRALVAGADGNFYGINSYSYPYAGSGRLIRMTPQGAVTILSRFESIAGSPIGLTLGGDGNLYGVTLRGGAFNDGIVFRANPASGKLARLFAFGANDANDFATSPQHRPILASDGNLYGISSYYYIWDASEQTSTAYRVTNPTGPVVNMTVAAQSGILLDLHCTYARLLGSDNTATPGVSFSFVRTGANPGTGAATANSSGVASHCWTGRTAGVDQVVATAAAESDVARVNWALRPVALTVGGFVEALPATHSVTVRPRAQMNDAGSGAPIAGRVIRFTSGKVALCSATTAADGSASCKTTLVDNVQTVVGRGVQANFDGDSLYAPKSVKGALACAGSSCVPP